MRFLLGQLNANGDCLYATILARQIKQDYPECELTWAISSQCSQILRGNPDVDKIWELKAEKLSSREIAWWDFEKAVLSIQTGSDPFDRVLLSQISPGNFRNYDGTIRPSILRAYNRPISVPIDSVINLSDQEWDRVDKFVRSKGIDQYSHRILFECSSTSGQSYVTPEFALNVALLVKKQMDDCCFILSTHEKIETESHNIISALELGIRENAALTHYCSLFVGCGSGLTVAATSMAAKELPNIQLLSTRTSVFASFFHDFEYFGKSSDRFIEMGDASAELVAEMIVTCCYDGISVGRNAYHRPLPVTFDFYVELIDMCLLQRGKYLDALESLFVTVKRYGWNEMLVDFGRNKILPMVRLGEVNNVDLGRRERVYESIETICSV